MKIKTVKEMRLDELLKYVWDNGITDVNYYDQHGYRISINGRCFYSATTVNDESLFKVEVEVEITEDTVRPFVVMGHHKDYKRFDAVTFTNFSIAQLENNEDVKFIYLQNEDGSIGELIWKDGKMVGGSEG